LATFACFDCSGVRAAILAQRDTVGVLLLARGEMVCTRGVMCGDSCTHAGVCAYVCLCAFGRLCWRLGLRAVGGRRYPDGASPGPESSAQ
jgi:hypothetical protein